MPYIKPSEQELLQFSADPVAKLVRENWHQFDLRGRPLRDPIFRQPPRWTLDHLALLRCVTAHDVPVERIVPLHYLPSSDDPELQRICNEIERELRGFKDKTPFAGLAKAVADADLPSGDPYVRGENILHHFCGGFVGRAAASMLREDLSIQHMIGSTEALSWYMGGSKYRWEAISRGYFYLESTVEADTVYIPIISQAVYIDSGEKLAIMLACASEEGKWSGEYEIQDVYQLSLDKPAKLTIDFVHFHHRHLSDFFCVETLPVNALWPIHRRRSIAFDLSNVQEAQAAARALLGLLRFLQSGEAKIPVLRDSMQPGSAEGSSER